MCGRCLECHWSNYIAHSYRSTFLLELSLVYFFTNKLDILLDRRLHSRQSPLQLRPCSRIRKCRRMKYCNINLYVCMNIYVHWSLFIQHLIWKSDILEISRCRASMIGTRTLAMITVAALTMWWSNKYLHKPRIRNVVVAFAYVSFRMLTVKVSPDSIFAFMCVFACL